MEAAGAEVPAFLDDDDESKPYGTSAYGGAGGYGPSGGYGAQGDWSSSGGGGGGGGGVYSDTASHGTYAQPPMSHESYPMHDFGPSNGNSTGVGIGGVFEHGDAFAAGGAAGAAAATRGINSDSGRSGMSSTAVGDSPYPAFLQHGYETGAGVGPGGYPAISRGAPGVVAGGAAGMAGIGRRSSMNTTGINRMKSQSSTGALSNPSTQPESYASHFQPGFAGPAQPEFNASTNSDPSAEAGAFTAGGANFSSAVHDAAFGGQEDHPLPNPFTSKMESDEGPEGEEDPYGGYGSEEEEQPKKVLKVANE